MTLPLGLYFLFFLWLNLLRLWGFGFDSNDLGVFQQVVWNLGHGHGPTYSIMYPYQPDANWLGFHFSVLTLAVMTPLYLLFPHPELFSVVHVTGMTLAALPLYAAIRALGCTARIGYLWTALYLLNPLQLYTLMFSYQELSLATPLLTLGLWAVVAKRFRMLLLACVGLVLSKEHFGLAVAGFGLLWALRHHDWKHGLRLSLSGLFCLYIVMFVLMPYLGGGHVMLNTGEYPPELRFDRYQWLLGPIADIPSTFLSFAFTSESLKFYALLLLPFLLLQFAGWPFLLPVAADLALIVLSKEDVTRVPALYYTSCIIPALALAACAGTVRLRLPVGKCGIAVLAVTLVLMVVYPLSKLPVNFSLLSDPDMVWSTDERMQHLKDFLEDKPVFTATQEIEPHLRQRHDLITYRDSAEPEGLLVLRMNPRAVILAHPPYFMISPQTVMRFLNERGWRITYWDDPFLVLAKDGMDDTAPRDAVLQKLQDLYELQQLIEQLRAERRARSAG